MSFCHDFNPTLNEGCKMLLPQSQPRSVSLSKLNNLYCPKSTKTKAPPNINYKTLLANKMSNCYTQKVKTIAPAQPQTIKRSEKQNNPNAAKVNPNNQNNNSYNRKKSLQKGNINCSIGCRELLQLKLAENSNYQAHKKWAAKQQMLKRLTEEQEFRECTFKPKINEEIQKNKDYKRFYQDQLCHNQRKKDKVNEMRQLIRQTQEKENTFHPQIRKNRLELNSKGQVHERLYNDWKSRGNSKEQTQEGSKNSSRKQQQPSISSLASRRYSDANYQPMSKRYDSQKRLQCISHSRNQEEGRAYSSKKPKNCIEYIKSIQFCANRILKEIYVIAKKINVCFNLSYLQLGFFLQAMHFINEDSTNQDRQALYDLWELLGGQTYQSVPIISIARVICAVMGLNDQKIVENVLQQSKVFEEAKQQGEESSKQGHEFIIVNQADSKSLGKKFQLFYLNRLKLGQLELRQSKSNQPTFQPELSLNCKLYAKKYRERAIAESQQLIEEDKIEFRIPEKGYLTHPQFLLLEDKKRHAKIEEMRRESNKTKELEEESISRGATTLQDAKVHQNLRQQEKLGQIKGEVSSEKWKGQYNYKQKINCMNAGPMKALQLRDQNSKAQKLAKAKSKTCFQEKTAYTGEPIIYINLGFSQEEGLKVPIYEGEGLSSIVEKVQMYAPHLDAAGLDQVVKQVVASLEEHGINMQ